MKPRQPPARERCQFHQAPTTSLGDVDRAVSQDLRPQTPAEVFSHMPPESLRCKECKTAYPLDARYVCEQCFGPLEVDLRVARRRRPGRAAAPDPGRPALAVALRRLPPGAERRRRARCPPAGRRCCAPTGSPSALGLREVWIKNDAANPTHSFKDRVVSVALARARELGFQTIACASTGNLANAVAAHAAAAGLESYVFIPADLEEQKVLATGDLRDEPGRRPRQLRRRQPALHRGLGRARLGVREHQHAPVLRRGLEDARVRDRRAARLGAAGPGRVRRSPPGRCSRRSPAGSRSGSSSAWSRASCRRSTAPRRTGCSPVASAFEAGQDFCRPVKPDTIAKSLAIGNPADGPYALDLARRTGGSVDSVTDDEIRDGIKLLARTTGIFTETAGGVTIAVLAKLAAARRHRSRRAGRRVHHRRGAEDARLRARNVRGVGDRADARRLRGRPASRVERPGLI